MSKRPMSTIRILAATAGSVLGLTACERQPAEAPAPAKGEIQLIFACMSDDAAPTVFATLRGGARGEGQDRHLRFRFNQLINVAIGEKTSALTECDPILAKAGTKGRDPETGPWARDRAPPR